MAYLTTDSSSTALTPVERLEWRADLENLPGPAASSGSVYVDALRGNAGVRIGPVSIAHVRALAEVPDHWPPIVVQVPAMTVLDGMHRVEAARALGRTSIKAVFVECDEDDALVEAVRLNVHHGLPLSLRERTRAARRLLTMTPARSDRALASICGLDHKTVARLRRELVCSDGEVVDLPVRIGRDDRARPVDPAMLRDRIAVALRESPDRSLRAVAREVGASPETVRDVRARLARGESPGPGGDSRQSREPTTDTAARAFVEEWPVWSSDTACQSRADAVDFAQWLDSGNVSLDWQRFVAAVPLSRVYEVSDQARAYAAAWREFADALEQRTRKGNPAALPGVSRR